MKLNLRRAAKHRLPKRERVPLYVPEHPDTVWSADCMFDALACGRRLRTFNVTDDFNREIIHFEVDTSITAQRLVRIFEQIRRDRPLPRVLRNHRLMPPLGYIPPAEAEANYYRQPTSQGARVA